MPKKTAKTKTTKTDKLSLKKRVAPYLQILQQNLILVIAGLAAVSILSAGVYMQLAEGEEGNPEATSSSAESTDRLASISVSEGGLELGLMPYNSIEESDLDLSSGKFPVETPLQGLVSYTDTAKSGNIIYKVIETSTSVENLSIQITIPAGETKEINLPLLPEGNYEIVMVSGEEELARLPFSMY